MKKIALVAVGITLGVSVYAQSRGTPNQIRTTIDATGALVAVAAAQVAPLTRCTFSNCRLLVDSQGRLVVSLDGAIPSPDFGLPIEFEGTIDYTWTQAATTSGFPDAADDELLLRNSLAFGNVLALNNLNAQGCSALTSRGSDGNEYLGFGYCNASNNVAIFAGANVLETWSGTTSAANPKRLVIAADGNYGSISSGFRFYQRQSIETDGGMKWWQLIPSGTTQVETMSLLVNGGLGIGLPTPLVMLHTQTQNSLQSGGAADQISADNTPPIWIGRKARGTVGSPAQTNSGDTLMQLAGYGFNNGGNFNSGQSAAINFVAVEAPTTSVRGGRIDFTTVTPTTTTSVVRFRATVAGLETAGGTPSVANVGANSCGTTTATIAGNYNAGRVTVGATSGTQCRVTVGAATTAWEGSCSNTTTAALCRFVPVSTTTFDLVGTFAAADVISYTALAR